MDLLAIDNDPPSLNAKHHKPYLYDSFMHSFHNHIVAI